MGDTDLDRKKKIMSDEYIRKADAIKQCGFGMTSLHIADNLRKMPPADVAPVVRCKDCKSRRIDGYCTKFQNNISGIAVSWFMPEDDGFCSYGERKGE